MVFTHERYWELKSLPTVCTSITAEYSDKCSLAGLLVLNNFMQSLLLLTKMLGGIIISCCLEAADFLTISKSAKCI